MSEEFIPEFEAHLRGRGFSLKTVAVYPGVIRRFARWWEGATGEDFDPAAVTPLDAADYRRHLLNRGRKAGTVNTALEVLRCFFGWLKKVGVVQDDPTSGVKRVPAERTLPRWLTRRQLGAVIRTFQKHGTPKDRALLALLLHAGLRVSEAVGLRTQDVVIRERSGYVIVRQGKGGKGREVPLNATARGLISEWLAQHPGGEWLFPGRNGRPMTARAAQKRLKELGRLAGVDATPHRLRHTFCKMLVDAGESLDRVALLAGHANLNTTAVYTKPGRSDLERAVEKLSWE